VDLDIEAYARVMAELCAASHATSRAEVLARHGLDEDRWDAIDARWQARLSEALDEDGDGISTLIAAYASAYEAAQRSLAAPISLAQFAQVTRLLQANGDLRAALAKVGVALSDYVRGSEHWSQKLANDPEIERRFEAALRGS
jgi:hypothetical protein